jgi:hypothetical protein
MDCLTMSFACAEVVLGVPLIVDAMAGEREDRRVLADAKKALDIAPADPLRCVEMNDGRRAPIDPDPVTTVGAKV